MTAAILLKIKEAKKNNYPNLFLNACNLEVFPLEILELTDLKLLDLRFNKLKKIPKEISRLINLETLLVNNNELEEFQIEITNLKKIKYITLNENPISPPPEIINRGIDHIFNYYTQLDETDFLFEIKLLVVGEERAGKTALSNSIISQDYILESEPTTLGINDIKVWNILGNEMNVDKNFRINLWDFGGQEIYHSTHQFFLTKRSIYLLVLESRKDIRYEDFYYWLNIIEILGDKSPVLIIHNKCDLPTLNIPFDEFKVAFPSLNLLDYIKVSCNNDTKSKSTIKYLKESIKEILKNKTLVPHLGTPLPKAWVKLREEIEALRVGGQNYLTYETYLQMCARHNLSIKKAEYLSDFFHDLGVCLHFKDNLILKNILFLNFEWITRAVYRLLDDQIVINNSGEFDNEDIARIWYELSYRNIDKELVALMRNEKFELCYGIGYNRYIAPQLLPVEAPNSLKEIKFENPMYFKYKYKFMPKGIISRIIVKNHGIIYKMNKWKNGVVLQHKDTIALIKENYFQRELELTLAGINISFLLELVNKSIVEIHGHYNNKLEFDEQISCVCDDCKQSEVPTFHNLKELKERRARKIKTIECRKSYEFVRVDDLLSNIVMGRDENFNEINETHLKTKIFISYSKFDEAYLQEFSDHLITLKDEGLIETFNCKEIDFGDEWDTRIRDEINNCDIIVFLVSAKLLNTDYIKKVEIPTAIKQGKLIIPIIIKACDWENSVLGKYQAAQRGKIVSLDNEFNLLNKIKADTEEERAAFWTSIIKELRRKIFNNMN